MIVIFLILAVLLDLILGFKLLRKSGKFSYDGDFVLNTTETGKKIYSLELNVDPEKLEDKKSIIFKVVSTLV